MAVNRLAKEGPLTEIELAKLAEFLKACKGGKAMNIEGVDGFFAALIAGPEVVPPSEYLPEVFGGSLSDTCEFSDIDEANQILGMLMRHWNVIASTLYRGDVYLPFLLEDDAGVCRGNDWARGFMRAVEMRRSGWAELLMDEQHGGCMVGVLALYHEHDPDPELRPDPIGPEQREQMITHMAAGIVRAYRYFRSEPPGADTAYRTPVKIGRNELCPCGSGKKYKRCCGGATIN